MDALTIADNEKFLRQISKKVDFTDKNLLNDISIVKEYLRENDNVFAMAAVQLGIAKRLVVIKSTSPDCSPNEEKDWLVLINPEIVSKYGRTEFWEFCQSGLTNFALVERPYGLVINYQDINGKARCQTFEGFVCTVLSHELDHLDGIFHMDRAKELMQMKGRDERFAWRKKHPYKIYSKEGKFEYKELSNKNLNDSI